MYSMLRTAFRTVRSARPGCQEVRFCDDCVQVADQRAWETAHRDRMAAIAIQCRY